MKRTLVAVLASISLAVLAGCSDPECASNEIKIGVTCYLRRGDAGLADAARPDDPGGKTRFDAALRPDGAVQTDAQEPAPALDDAGRALEDGDAAMMMTTTSQCGDGKVTGNEVCDRAIATGQAGACQTATTCTSTDKCLVAKLSGDPETCSARCETEPLAVCMTGDGCCPTKCTPANDGECSTGCGDGFVDAAKGETCEGAGCPGSCDDHDACTADKLIGSASNCNAACTAPAISADHTKKDSCCPSGANAGSDLDCAGCGNGVVETGEQCDGNCPTSCDDGNACTVDRLLGVDCQRVCAAPIAVTNLAADGCCVSGENQTTEPACPARCGNGVVEASEQCDSSAAVCSTACQWQDIPGTPGDDRPGYVACGPVSCRPPEEICVRDRTPAGAAGPYYCAPRLSNGHTDRLFCDGPEDCSAPRFCEDTVEESDDVVCNDLSTKYAPVICHVDSDCGTLGKCTAGRCPLAP